MTKAINRNEGTSPTIFDAFEMAPASFDDILVPEHTFANSRIQNLHNLGQYPRKARKREQMPKPPFGSATPLFNGAIRPPGIPSSSDIPPPFPPDRKSAMNEIFFGPNGLRAGWRLLIFAAIIAT